MLQTLKVCYPSAEIVCGTLLRTNIQGADSWEFPESFAGISLGEYNNAIRYEAHAHRCCLADLACTGYTYETLDGTHPTAQGHFTISQAWIRCLHGLGILDSLV